MHVELITLQSKDGVELKITSEYLKKAPMLKRMLKDLGYEAGDMPTEPIPLPTITGEALRTVDKWLELHKATEPRSEEHRKTNRFNRFVSKEDLQLLNKLNRTQFADVVHAAYFLDIADLSDTLVKYCANSLEGKTAEQMCKWLEVPMKMDERKTSAEDDSGAKSPQKKERN